MGLETIGCLGHSACNREEAPRLHPREVPGLEREGQNEVEINSLVTKPLRGIKGNLPKDLSGSRKLTLGGKVHRS